MTITTPKRAATPDDIEFLANLQETMRNQDDFGQASPAWWGIMSYEYQLAADNDEISRVVIYDDGGREYLSVIEFVELMAASLSNDGVDDDGVRDWFSSRSVCVERDTCDKWYADADDCAMLFPDDLKAMLNDSECYPPILCDAICYETLEPAIVRGPMFLTHAACEKHLAENHYHYHPNAHPYAMTAWRCPETARLWEILENVDFASML